MLDNVKIIGLNGAEQVAKEVAKKLKINLVKVTTSHFADGEILVRPEETVRNQRIFVIQSLIKPVNESLMQLLICLDSLKRASAKEIVVLLCYYAYARQDRKSIGREPVTAKLVANLIQTAGANKVVALDIHSEQIQGFFEIPFDNLTVLSIAINDAIKNLKHENICIVSPDYGSVKRARRYAKLLNCNLAILDKRRPKPNVAQIMNILGDVKNKDCLIVDDMIDTAGTVCEASQAIKNAGARSVNVVAAHAVLSGNAKQRIKESFKNKYIDHLTITNTIPSAYEFKDKHVTVINVSDYIVGVTKVIFSNNLSLSRYANGWFGKPKNKKN